MTGFVSGPQEQGADREAGRCEGLGETPWGRCEALSSWAASVDCGLPDRAAARRERLAHRARRGPPPPPFGPRRGLARLIRAVPTLGPRSPRSLVALAGRERRSVCPEITEAARFVQTHLTNEHKEIEDSDALVLLCLRVNATLAALRDAVLLILV